MSNYQLLVADSRQLPFEDSLNAKLIWCDPPRNIGVNEGATTDRLDDNDYRNMLRDFILSLVYHMAHDSRIVFCVYHKTRHIIESIMLKEYPSIRFEQEIIWEYEFGLYTRKRFVPSHDNILVYKKNQPKFNWEAVSVWSQRMEVGDPRADWRGRTPGTVWKYSRVQGNSKSRRHLTTARRSCQPEALCERAVKAWTNEDELVFDPFMGTGTMAVVCRRLQRTYIGVDICKYYVEEVNERLNGWRQEFINDS